MFTRTLALSAVLCVVGSTAAAQLQIVQQTRSVSGSADADAPGGIILYDSFSDTAPDAGPYTATGSAQVNGAWGGSSSGASQMSVLGGQQFSGTGYATASAFVPFSADQGNAFGSSESEEHVTFDVLVPQTFSIVGSLTRYGASVNPSVRLRRGTTTVFSFEAPGTSGTTSIQASGVLAPGTYDFTARANGSAYANMFYSQDANSAFVFTFDVEPIVVPFCFGDGTGTACPCGNSSPAGADAGCLNSLGQGGALRATGMPSLTNDSLVLHGTQMTNGWALYYQGTLQADGGNGAVFGDGKRCATGSITRLSANPNVAGTSRYPDSAQQSISVRGGVGAPGTRTYQVWYRNVASFCSPDGFNLTNGVAVEWQP